MARIKIEIPEKIVYKTEIPIRITDINYGGHLGNDSVFSICHEARVRFFNSLGFEELNIAGKGIIMADAGVQYKTEGFYGDILLVQIAISDVTKSGCDIIYQIKNKKNGIEIALVKTGISFYDYKNKKIVSVPKEFISKIESIS